MTKVLMDLGVYDENGKQQHRINRDHIQKVIEWNGGEAKYLYFSRLDLRGADLRGMDLRQTYFECCDLSEVVAIPAIELDGQILQIGDSATERTLSKWDSGILEEYITVTETLLNGAFLGGSNLDGAVFAYAQMEQVKFGGVHADRTNFYKANLKKSVFRFAQLDRVDLRSADLRDANLYGLRITTEYLDGINWGDKYVSIHEKKGKWDEAIPVYRVLSRVHELAGMNDIAGKFRYRLQKAKSGKILQKANLQVKERRGRCIGANWAWGLLFGRPAYARWIGRCLIDLLWGFGEKPFSVVRALGLSVLLFAFVYVDYGGSPNFTTDGLVEFFFRFIRALYFSAASSTALGYGSWIGHEIGFTKYLGVGQSFVGTVLIALFLVMFARRWTR